MNRLALDAIVSQYEIQEANNSGALRIDNGVRCQFPFTQVGGSIYQILYSGKNLLDIDNPKYAGITSGHVKQLPKIENGKLYNAGKYAHTQGATMYVEIPEGSEKLTFSTNVLVNSGSNTYMQINLFNEINEDGSIVNNFNSGAFKVNYTDKIIKTVDVTGYKYAGFAFWADEYYTCSISKIQFEIGEQATSYEPFTGNKKTPNTDFIIEPVFSNNFKLKSVGKNLLNINDACYGGYSRGVPRIFDLNNKVTFPYKVSHSGSAGICFITPVYKGVTYTLSLTDKNDVYKSIGMSFYENIEDITNDRYALDSISAWSEYKPLSYTPLKNGYIISCLAAIWQSNGEIIETIYNITDKIMLEIGSSPTQYESYKEYSQVNLPQLLCSVDGNENSTWNPNTGNGLNYWHEVIELDGSDDEVWGVYTNDANEWYGFSLWGQLPEKMARNANWSNQFPPSKKGETSFSPHIWCGVQNNVIYICAHEKKLMPFYDDNLEDKGKSNWIEHLKLHPLKIWVARNEPIDFFVEPQKLIQGSGTTSIIQTDSKFMGSPINIEYVTHKQ